MEMLNSIEIPYLNIAGERKMIDSECQKGIIAFGEGFLMKSPKPYKAKALDIPIWERYTLSIEEAAEYFRIGRNRMRQIIRENPNADFILTLGNRVQIKRKRFEKYIDDASVL